MKARSFFTRRRRPPQAIWAEPLAIETTDGAQIVDLSPEMVARCRRLHTRLARAGTLPPRLGLIAALREEGVTSIALGLAAVAAHDINDRVCVVELNTRWPGLAQQAGIEPTPGLAEVIARRAELGDALRPTSLDNLWLLPAGDLAGESPSRLARSQALGAALDDLGQQFDHLIMDLPALLATDDTAPMAEHADVLALVIRHGVVPMPLVKEALDQVAHLQVVGVVLNGDQTAIPDWLLRLIGRV